MRVLKRLFLISLFTSLLSSCNIYNLKPGCQNEIVEWVDVVMIQDITYQHHFPESKEEMSTNKIEKGRELGKVSYKMADDACSNHKMKNGDAAYIEEGTTIYEVKGSISSYG